jgi:hypothetical protein
MTTPFERTRALVYAGEFLESLLLAESGDISAVLRNEAHRILRHYPSNMEIGWMADASQHTGATMQQLDPEAVPLEIRKGYRR